MTPLAIRLTHLLDVLQQIHHCSRAHAASLLATACDLGPAYVLSLASGAVRHQRLSPMHYDAPLSQLESRYRKPLSALRAYERACRT